MSQGIWRRIGPTDASRVTAWATAIQAIGVVVALWYAAQTLRDSNRVAWRTFLDTRSVELGRMLIERESLRCAYHYGLPQIDNLCPDKVKANLSEVIEYVAQTIGVLDEAQAYSEAEDKDYYADWYQDDADDLSADPTGIVSFVLWEEFGCTSVDQCDIAKRLKICIAGEDGVVPDEDTRNDRTCFDSLSKKYKKFLATVGANAPSASTKAARKGKNAASTKRPPPL